MKKLSLIFLVLFMGISTANAIPPANANGSANANANLVDPLRGDLRVQLQSGLTIAEILSGYANASSPYAITEVIGALTEVADPSLYDEILAQTQIYAPIFAPVINEVINLYRADIAQGGVPAVLDPTAAFAATAAGQQPATPSPSAAAINQANALIANLNNAGPGILIAVSP